MARLKFVLFALLFFLVVFALSTGVTAANNTTPIQQNTSKALDPWNTRTGTSYTTIQEAINDAQPGDTIIAETGTYTENIQINKKITLTGQGTPTIQALDPSQATITINDTANGTTITGFTIKNGYHGIYIQASNCTITNNTITNNSWDGISFWYSSGNTINNNITNNWAGIHLYYSSDNTISGNNINNNSESGIYLDGSSGNTISGNNINNNGAGIYLYWSSDNTISGNNIINNNGDGIGLWCSSGCVLRGNVVENCVRGFSVEGDTVEDFILDVDTSNTIDGKPIYYLVGCTNSVYNGVAMGYLALVNCENVTVMNVELSGNGQGILIVNTTSSKIQNFNINNNGDGIKIYSSSNNIITQNNITNSGDGIYLRESSGNTISENKIKNNILYGIHLDGSSGNTISGNNITNNSVGIYFYWSSDNTISGNNINNNTHVGIYLDGSSCNRISGNNITNNSEGGIYLYYSDNNKVYKNSFIGNGVQAKVEFGTGNLFNLDKPIGGNFWSDYTGTDGDGDGFGDTPYIFTGGEDKLPLIITISVSNLTVMPISGVAPLNITATAKLINSGDIQGDYTAQLKINNQVVDSKTVTVPAMTTITIEFTRMLQPGTYNVTIDNLTPVTVTVSKPANITVGNLTVMPISGVAPLNITATAKLINSGDIQGDYTAQLKINNQVVDSKTVTVPAMTTITIEFTRMLQPGTYNVTIDNLTPVTVTVYLTINSIEPADGAVSVPLNRTIIVAFSNNILEGPGYNNITVKLPNGTVKTITKSISGNKLYIKATGGWSPGVKFIITIPKNAIQNSAGSMLQTNFTSSFTAAIKVKSIDPANGAVNVPKTKTITITFSNNILKGPDYNKITVKTSTGTTKTITKTISGNKLYIKATGGWNPGVKFIITIPKNAVKNSAGSMLQTDFKSSFTAAR